MNLEQAVERSLIETLQWGWSDSVPETAFLTELATRGGLLSHHPNPVAAIRAALWRLMVRRIIVYRPFQGQDHFALA